MCVSVCRCIYVYMRGRVRVNVCISNDQTPHENPIKYQLKKVLEAYHLTKMFTACLGEIFKKLEWNEKDIKIYEYLKISRRYCSHQ